MLLSARRDSDPYYTVFKTVSSACWDTSGSCFIIGPLARIRTGTTQFLRLLPLPVGLQADMSLIVFPIL